MALAGVVAILIATLHPLWDQVGNGAETPLWCLVCGDLGGVDVLLNLLLFLPFAVGLRLAGQSWRRVVMYSAGLSLTVELLQLTAIPGRDASLSDLITNTLGAAVGAWAASQLPGIVFPGPRAALRLALAGSGAWLLVLLASAWLLAPWVPPTPLGSSGAPKGSVTRLLRGEVAGDSTGIALPAKGLSNSVAEAFRRPLQAGTLDLKLDLISGPPAEETLWIFVMYGGLKPVVVLSQEGRDLVLALPARALRFRLQPPALRLTGGMPAEANRPVGLNAGARAGRIWIATDDGRVPRSAELRLSPTFGWSLLSPSFLLGRWSRPLTMIWVGIVMLPLGYWASRVGRAPTAVACLVTALALGLGAVPFLTGFGPAAGADWGAGIFGAMVGWALREPAAYLAARCRSPSVDGYS